MQNCSNRIYNFLAVAVLDQANDKLFHKRSVNILDLQNWLLCRLGKKNEFIDKLFSNTGKLCTHYFLSAVAPLWTNQSNYWVEVTLAHEYKTKLGVKSGQAVLGSIPVSFGILRPQTSKNISQCQLILGTTKLHHSHLAQTPKLT